MNNGARTAKKHCAKKSLHHLKMIAINACCTIVQGQKGLKPANLGLRKRMRMDPTADLDAATFVAWHQSCVASGGLAIGGPKVHVNFIVQYTVDAQRAWLAAKSLETHRLVQVNGTGVAGIDAQMDLLYLRH